MISIIGAGPVGCYLAYLLAKKGQNVRIFEEHDIVGKPIQCTGIVTEDIFKLVRLDKGMISNITSKAVIHSKGRKVEVNTKEIVLYRDKFDRYLLKLAVDAGVELYKGYKYESFDKSTKTVYFTNKKSFKTDILVGADGPNSAVARTNGLIRERDFYVGVQARVKIKTSKDSYQVFLGDDFPKFFGWIVPEDCKAARVGIAARKDADGVFTNFLKNLNIKDEDILEKQGGLIPVYSPSQSVHDGCVFLVGDAAGMVKASTGGGIIPGLKAAKVLCDCIINKKEFDKEFNKALGRSLWLHLRIRAILDKFSDTDYDILIGYINQRRVRDILRCNSRENPLVLLVKLLVVEPRFLRFLSKL